MRHPLTAVLAGAALFLAAGCAQTKGAAAPPPDSPHRVNILAGASFDRAGDGVALGGNYEYLYQEKLGFGGFADVAFGSDTSTTIGGGVYWHPIERWSVLGGAGAQFADGDSDVIARIGGWYEFPFKDKYTLAPTGWLDLGAGDPALFIGVGFGLRF